MVRKPRFARIFEKFATYGGQQIAGARSHSTAFVALSSKQLPEMVLSPKITTNRKSYDTRRKVDIAGVPMLG